MKVKTTCHPNKVRKTQKGYEVKLKFSEEQFLWIVAAADICTKGCADDLIANCFWNEFERLSKEIKKKIDEQLSGQTPRH